MKNKVLQFLETYKSLDQVCKKVLKSETGITSYINQMESYQSQRLAVVNWESDLKQLKRLRHIRNKLAHETNTFGEDLFTLADIDFLKTFESRILNSDDPLATLKRNKCGSSHNEKSSAQKRRILSTSNIVTFCVIAFEIIALVLILALLING